MNANEYTSIKASREALQALIDELTEFVATIDTTPEEDHEKWADSDNFGDFIDRSNDSRFAKSQINKLVNIGLCL